MSVRYEMRRLADLDPNPANPRKIRSARREALGASLKMFGPVESLVFNERSGRLVGGHQRRELLLEQGVEEAMVSVVDLTDEQEAALNATLNNKEAQGEFTDEIGGLLDSALKGLSLDDFQTLRLDKLHRPDGEPDIAVVETSEVHDEFWISVRGPLAGQADAINALKAHLRGVAGVTVEVGTIKR